MVQIQHVRVGAPGTEERHITDVRWYNPESGAMGTTKVAGMVEFIKKGGRVYTCNGHRITEVEWVDDTVPYIRSRADQSVSDNLLSLPRME